ncbi:putative nachr subunit [Schistosoma mansoni]|uniref:putative nachr subunit n=1 Tax=Schistosoma mansoni TaxID=6183 RepID=UPI00022DC9E9|nr:putative nachr subunit [Schistosoma mansoni]|eukprot:XP_018654873.1 putative nachr subunit [Schistosoma mansoni]
MKKHVIPSSEKRLIKQLIDNYEKAGKIGRPVKNTKDRVVVGYGLSLFQLLDLDEKNQILTINVWAKYTWIDQLLRWDPANYSNIREVRIPPSVIWTPDIKRDVMLNVDYMGRVFWSPPAIFKSNCPIDIKNFPFDYQHCFLKFASWTYNSEQLDLQFLDNRTEVDIDQYTSSNEWSLVARPAYRFVMLSDECGKEIPDLTFFLLYLLVFPCVLLSVITTVIFWLPPQIPAKMILSMNIFVAFSLLLKILAVSTPSASTIVPYLGYFYCLNMTLLSLSTFASTIVVHLHFQRVKSKHVPPWLIKVVRFFATLLHVSKLEPPVVADANQKLSAVEAQIKNAKMKQSVKSENLLDTWSSNQQLPPSNPQSNLIHSVGVETQWDYNKISSPEEYLLNPNELSVLQKQQLSMLSDGSRISYCTSVNGCQFSSHHYPNQNYLQHKSIPWGDYAMNQSNESGTAKIHDKMLKKFKQSKQQSRGSTIKLEFNLGDLCNALKQLMLKIAKKDEIAQRDREWRLVLMTIDRLFCWFYSTVVIVAGVYLLFPRGRSHTVNEIIAMHQEAYDMRNQAVAKQCMMGYSKTI